MKFAPYIRKYQYKKYVDQFSSIRKSQNYIGNGQALCHIDYMSDLKDVIKIFNKNKEIMQSKFEYYNNSMDDDFVLQTFERQIKDCKLVLDHGLFDIYQSKFCEIITDKNGKYLFIRKR